ncbi:CCR4-NOT transcription complex subunit 7/8 [Geosmithia morbida]|uniref:poly(A)-specific ribonuclease n=1 Tax=Geosmithia morbida TaxID=1094350 RepID=A0A9P5D1W3_9HYPO|nr:CCR4-NOT transcription complex subunit 7/8 [Geosmithia morbida]KAF4123182.1 CCR4-NOT transcription complex subunit 7/8 [Geosmithia morbida]
MPPQLRGFGAGAPFPQPGFASHAQPQGGPMGASQYLNASAQMGPFSGANANTFSVAGLGGPAAGFPDTGFGSQSARMGFTHGPAAAAAVAAAMAPPPHHSAQLHHALAEHQPLRQQGNRGRIREVWKHNLQEEMAVLRDLVDRYPYIAMDTEFPGVVSRPMGAFRGKSDYHYQCLRTNVDMLKVIQIGLTLFNEDGETPPARPQSAADAEIGIGRRQGSQPFPCSWQFNFNFSLKDDMYNEKSIESLQQAGIDFNMLERDGIDPHEFAALLIPSGLVCFDDVKWISFHGGYDFGYLTKLLICTPLPNDEVDFDHKMKLYFPSTYDVKHLMKHAIKLHNSGLLSPSDPMTVEILQKFEHKSGLENIAETLKVKRVGAAHQAGSDSLLTGKVFFQMRDKIFNGDIPDDHVGKVWGLGVPDSGLIMASMMATGGGGGGGGGGSGVDSSHGQVNGNGPQAPSTPNTSTVGLSTTPAAQSHNTNGLSHMGPMTPGGGGGVFGSFAFTGNNR